MYAEFSPVGGFITLTWVQVRSPQNGRYNAGPIAIAILEEADAGVPVKELCRKHGMAAASVYARKKKYGGHGRTRAGQGRAHRHVREATRSRSR